MSWNEDYYQELTTKVESHYLISIRTKFGLIGSVRHYVGDICGNELHEVWFPSEFMSPVL